MRQELATQAVDATVASTASKMAVGGSGVALLGALTLNDLAMIIGMAVGLIGVIVQILAQLHAARARQKDDKRKDELHRARLHALARTGRDVCETGYDSERGPL